MKAIRRMYVDELESLSMLLAKKLAANASPPNTIKSDSGESIWDKQVQDSLRGLLSHTGAKEVFESLSLCSTAQEEESLLLRGFEVASVDNLDKKQVTVGKFLTNILSSGAVVRTGKFYNEACSVKVEGSKKQAERPALAWDLELLYHINNIMHIDKIFDCIDTHIDKIIMTLLNNKLCILLNNY